ncbi:MAG: DUF2971 domain-containing protein [Bdellovibrionota bacterium]
MDEMTNEFEETSKLIWTEFLTTIQTDKEKTYFHYSDLESAKSIIEKSVVWATYIKHSNDFTEFEHGMNMFIEHIKKSDILNPIIKENEVILRYFEDQLNQPSMKPFIFCFSEVQDQLSQWRGYADFGKGACTGFQFSKEGLPKFSLLKKVIYSDSEKILIIENIIKKYENLASKIGSHLPTVLKQAWWARFVSDLISVIVIQSCFFKDVTFAEEKEYRLVFYKHDYNQFEFRNSGNRYITFVKEKINVDFNKIILGPITQKITFESFTFMKKTYLLPFTVEKSKIPFH